MALPKQAIDVMNATGCKSCRKLAIFIYVIWLEIVSVLLVQCILGQLGPQTDNFKRKKRCRGPPF